MGEEALALEAMKIQQMLEAKKLYDCLVHVYRLTPAALKNTGFQTPEAAARAQFELTDSRIKKLVADHLKKYPD